MTQAAYARHQGVSRQAVGIWAKNGLLKLVDDATKPGRKMVDVDASDAALLTKVDNFRGRDRSGSPPPKPAALRKSAVPSKTAKAVKAARPSASLPSDETPDLNKVRTALLIEQTAGLKLKNAQAAGELVLKIEAERRLTEFARKIRSKITAVVRDTSERLSRIDEPRSIIDLLSSEFDTALVEIANSIDEDEG